jgi:hypothetical protein
MERRPVSDGDGGEQGQLRKPVKVSSLEMSLMPIQVDPQN